MAMSKASVRSTSQLVKSYKEWIRGSGFPEAEIQVVIDGTVIILRRNCTQGTICSGCGNNDLNRCHVTNVDKLGFITKVQCLVCGKDMSTVCRKSKYYFEQVKDESVLERGDHIVWRRALAYYHHGIVTRQHDGRVAVVHYTVSDSERPCATVTEKEYPHGSMASMIRGSVYRVIHSDCYTNEYTALRAERTIGEETYDLFEQNCEHSTTWSKTGLHSSYQLESCFTSIGKIILSVFLRAVMLAVLWLLQICHFTEGSAAAADSLWVERGVNIAYVTLIASAFATYSIYKGCSKMKSSVESPQREPRDDDWMESCRKGCSNDVFQCCCRGHPSCSRLTCSLCFIACICCSLGQATCSFCATKLRVCGTPCCGRSVPAVFSLVVGSVVRELIAASGPFIVVWYADDILSYFDARDVSVSDNQIVNRAVIVLLAVIVASIVAYPVGVLVSRWVEALFECYCCPCGHPSNRATLKHNEYVGQPCPVHDKIMTIPAPYGDYHVTKVPIFQSANQRSAVIPL